MSVLCCLVCVCCVCSFRLRLLRLSISCVCPSCASVYFLRLSISCVCPSCASVYLLRLSVYFLRLSVYLLRLLCCMFSNASLNLLYLLCVLCLLYVMSNSSGSIVYLPIHSNASFSISLKRLSGSTCLTCLECLECSECSECLKCLRWFEGFKGSYNNSYNPLSKSHNSFSCPYRLLDYMNRDYNELGLKLFNYSLSCGATMLKYVFHRLIYTVYHLLQTMLFY